MKILLVLSALILLTLLPIHGVVLDSVYDEEPWRGDTIIIFEDGGIYPNGAPIERVNDNTYVLTRDIEVSRGDGIVILRDNIVFDGNGRRIIGNTLPNPRGVFIYYGDNVKLTNLTISGFRLGVIVLGSNGVEVRDLDVSGASHAIVLYQSNDCRVVNNVVSDSLVGIYLYWSSENTIVDNSFADTGILVYGYTSNNIVVNNTINGKQILYLEGASGIEITGDYAQILLVNSRNVRIRGHRLYVPAPASIGMVNVTDMVIENNDIANSLHGIYITLSDNILVTKNTITNSRNCIWLSGVIDSKLIENKIINCDIGMLVTSTGGSGTSDIGSSSIFIEGNLIESYRSYGILINASRSARIFNNTITGSGSTSTGIEIKSSENITIIWNTISRNRQGLLLGDSRLNTVLYNDFLNNNKHVDIQGLVQSNKWDDGGKGNYWDDHPCVDNDNNNICDDPYIIRAPDNVDNYPLRLSAKELIQNPQAMITSTPAPTMPPTPPSPQATFSLVSPTTPTPPTIIFTSTPVSTSLTNTPYVTMTGYINTDAISTSLPVEQTITLPPSETIRDENSSSRDDKEVPNDSEITLVSQTLTPINKPVNVTTIDQYEQISLYITIVIITFIAFIVISLMVVTLHKLTRGQ